MPNIQQHTLDLLFTTLQKQQDQIDNLRRLLDSFTDEVDNYFQVNGIVRQDLTLRLMKLEKPAAPVKSFLKSKKKPAKRLR